MTPSPRLVLASASPRRRELLGTLGVPFEVEAADLDECPIPGEDAAPYVERLARAKARAVAERRGPGVVALGADTVVALDGALLGKPRDDADARTMLAGLQGRWHEVLTGVALAGPQGEAAEVVTTRVLFAPMSEAEIAAYVRSGEPRDKAGAYAIQGLGALFVEAIDGNYPNVVGLPLPATRRLLQRFGIL